MSVQLGIFAGVPIAFKLFSFASGINLWARDTSLDKYKAILLKEYVSVHASSFWGLDRGVIYIGWIHLAVVNVDLTISCFFKKKLFIAWKLIVQHLFVLQEINLKNIYDITPRSNLSNLDLNCKTKHL